MAKNNRQTNIFSFTIIVKIVPSIEQTNYKCTMRSEFRATRYWNKKQSNYFQTLPKTQPQKLNFKSDISHISPKSSKIFGLILKEIYPHDLSNIAQSGPTVGIMVHSNQLVRNYFQIALHEKILKEYLERMNETTEAEQSINWVTHQKCKDMFILSKVSWQAAL